MGKSKKKLRRELRSCREHLDEVMETLDEMAGRDTAAAGICEPAPSTIRVESTIAGDGSFVSRAIEEAMASLTGKARRGGIRFTTPDYEGRDAADLRLKLEDRDRQLSAERATVARHERTIAEQERHLHHHHTEGVFTLVRDVTPQVARMNVEIGKRLDRAEASVSTLVHERNEARWALAWHVGIKTGDEDQDWGALIDAWRDRSDDDA